MRLGLSIVAIGADVLIAQTGIACPMGVDLPLVLGVEGVAPLMGPQITIVAQQRGRGIGVFGPNHLLQLDPADPLMPAGQGLFVLEAGVDAAVCEGVGQAHGWQDAFRACGLGLVVVAVPATDVELQLDQAVGGQGFFPLPIQAQHPAVFLVLGAGFIVTTQATPRAGLRQGFKAGGGRARGHQEGHQRQGFARRALELKAGGGVDAVASGGGVVDGGSAQRAWVGSQALTDQVGFGVGRQRAVVGGEGVIGREMPVLFVFAEGDHFRDLTPLRGHRRLQVHGLAALALPGDDVDGAGHRLGARFGRGGAVNFDALDHLGRERFDGETRWYPLTVQQNLGVTHTQAAHANAAAASRRPPHGNPRLALQHIANVVVAHAFNFFMGDDDFADGGFAPFFDLVIPLVGDFHLAHVGHGGRLCPGLVKGQKHQPS